jgi:MinD-like ATPase involved in chromosome partitioning or flagellar assembly
MEEVGMGDGKTIVPRVVTVIGATRGIGRSSLALNLAVAARRGQRVCLLDAAGGLALRAGAAEDTAVLADVVLGRARLSDALAQSADGVDVLTLSRSERRVVEPLPQSALLAHIDALEPHYDVVVIDAPSGLLPAARFFAAAATEVVLVVTPQTQAIRQAQVLLRILASHCGRHEVLALPNACPSPDDATAIMQTLGAMATRPPHVRVLPLGWIPLDDAVAHARLQRRAVVTSAPESPAARALVGAANRLLAGAPARPTGGAQFFFQTLIAQGRAA